MDQSARSWTLEALAPLLGATLDGPGDVVVRRPGPADTEDDAALTFADRDEFLETAEVSGAAAVIIRQDARAIAKPALRVAHPRAAFGRFLAMVARPLPLASGIHPTAVVDPTATIDPSASIGAYAVIERGASIGPKAKIYPFVFVGENCRVGEGAIVFPQAVLYQDVNLGARCIVHSGAILGADGFGYAWDGTRHQKIPQVGQVILEDDVEIGANATVDRATMAATRIGFGSKVDNLVQVGHNVQIGQHTVIAGLVGLSGSTKVGSNCVLAGQVGTSQGVSITNGVTLGGRSGVTKDITVSGDYWGTPAIPFRQELRVLATQRSLPEVLKRLKELEQRLEALESK